MQRGGCTAGARLSHKGDYRARALPRGAPLYFGAPGSGYTTTTPTNSCSSTYLLHHVARYPEHEYAYGALDYNPCLHEPMRVQMTYHTYTSPTPATSSWGARLRRGRRCATRRVANPPTLPLRNLQGHRGY